MKLSAIIIVIAVSTVANGATVRYDGKDSKKNSVSGEFPVTKPTIVETSSRSSQEDMHLTQVKMQANQIENARIHNSNKYAYQSEMSTPQSYHGQDQFSTDSPAGQDFSRDQVVFHSQQSSVPATTLSSPQNDQFDDQYRYQAEAYTDQAARNQQYLNVEQQQQFYNDKEQASIEQQFYNNNQESSQDQFYGSDRPSQEQFYGNNQKSQEQFFNQQAPKQDQFFNNQQSQEQIFSQQPPKRDQFFNNQQSQEQIFNQQSPKQEQFYGNNQKSQEQFYNQQQEQQFINAAVGVEGQKFSSSPSPFQGISNQQSTQISTGKHSTQIQTQGVVQLSAFDNREQPIVLPRGAVQSASVVVSGLKNLPVLPAMVYNAGSVPATHAVAFTSDPLYKGASVRQHMQTPYVRYVYSHIL